MANNVNTQIRENPRLQQMPSNQAEWRHFINELGKYVADLTVTGRFSTDTLFPQVTLANRGSVQDSTPLAATDAGASATITVASHILYRQAGALTYNSGSITGLSYDTKYYVYADDPDYAGGSVTYLASATKDNIVGNMGRYFVGEIITPEAAAAATTGAPGAGFGVLQLEITRLNADTISLVNTDPETDIAAVTARVTALENDLASNTPVYTVTNDVTDRGFDADAASGSISATPTQAEVENIRDAVLELADVLGTVIADFQTKDVFG